MLPARWFLVCVASLAAAAPAHAKTMAEVLAASKPADWRPLDPANTLYVEWDAGRVVIELAPEFAPGTIATELARNAVLGSEAAKQRIMSRTPMKRLGEPGEIAEVVAFLLSDAASYLTGEIVYADGGRLTLNYTV